MPETVFLELDDHIGIEPEYLHERDKDGAPKPHPNAGEPGPLVAEGLTYAVPVMVKDPSTGKDELGSEPRSVRILPRDSKISDGQVIDAKEPDVAPDARIIPGTRTIETTSVQLAALLDGNGYHRVDGPKSSAQTRAKNSTGQEG